MGLFWAYDRLTEIAKVFLEALELAKKDIGNVATITDAVRDKFLQLLMVHLKGKLQSLPKEIATDFKTLFDGIELFHHPEHYPQFFPKQEYDDRHRSPVFSSFKEASTLVAELIPSIKLEKEGGMQCTGEYYANMEHSRESLVAALKKFKNDFSNKALKNRHGVYLFGK